MNRDPVAPTSADPEARLREYLARPAGAPFPSDALARLDVPVDPAVLLGLLAEAWRCEGAEPCGREERAKLGVVEAIARTRNRAPELVAAIERLHRDTTPAPDDGAMSPSPDHNDMVLDVRRATDELHRGCEAALRTLREEPATPTRPPPDRRELAARVAVEHALGLEARGRIAEALAAIRAAIDDLPFDEGLLAIEHRLYAAQRARR
jgi:hypothetical protein